MKVINLSVENFRGIKHCYINFPIKSNLICMIGPGDSTKSTVLKAIEWALWPSWNLQVSDNDFYQSNTNEIITIELTLTQVADALLTQEKFGLYQRSGAVLPSDNDEPTDDDPACLTIRLSIESDLDPRWEVICNRLEPKPISNRDRQALEFSVIGQNCERDFVWNRLSVLQRFAESKEIINDALISTLRNASSKADLSGLDDVSSKVLEIGNDYGVDFEGNIQNRLFINSSSLSSSIGLFDQNAPLLQRGKGSQRLVSMGLNLNATNNNAVLLIDEIENGLEPYRLRSLINKLREREPEKGQVIMTTHSPVVVAECTNTELFIVRSTEGITTLQSLKYQSKPENQKAQAHIRSNPEAYLSKRLIVCEGKTEIGFIRALDSYLQRTKGLPMAYKGVSACNGNGDEIFDIAKHFVSCGYDVCLFLDSDNNVNEKNKAELKETLKIQIFDWDSGNSIEEQLFQDVSYSIAEELIQIPIDDRDFQSVLNKLKHLKIDVSGTTIGLSRLNKSERKSIGTLAKTNTKENKPWYKRIDLGELLGNVIFAHWDEIDENSMTKKTITGLMNWIYQK